MAGPVLKMYRTLNSKRIHGPRARNRAEVGVSVDEGNSRSAEQHRVAEGSRPPYVVLMNGLPQLRQVVAERSEHHVFDCFRSEGRRPWEVDERREAVTYPCSANQIRVLQADLQAALRTVVGLVPESGGALHHALVLTHTASQDTRLEPGPCCEIGGSASLSGPRHGLSTATRVVKQR